MHGLAWRGLGPSLSKAIILDYSVQCTGNGQSVITSLLEKAGG